MVNYVALNSSRLCCSQFIEGGSKKLKAHWLRAQNFEIPLGGSKNCHRGVGIRFFHRGGGLKILKFRRGAKKNWNSIEGRGQFFSFVKVRKENTKKTIFFEFCFVDKNSNFFIEWLGIEMEFLRATLVQNRWSDSTAQVQCILTDLKTVCPHEDRSSWGLVLMRTGPHEDWSSRGLVLVRTAELCVKKLCCAREDQHDCDLRNLRRSKLFS
jgi:hypothetical protein